MMINTLYYNTYNIHIIIHWYLRLKKDNNWIFYKTLGFGKY